MFTEGRLGAVWVESFITVSWFETINAATTLNCCLSPYYFLKLISFCLNQWCYISIFFTCYLLAYYFSGCHSYFPAEGRGWFGAKSWSMGKNRPVLSWYHWYDLCPHHISPWWNYWKGASYTSYKSLSRMWEDLLLLLVFCGEAYWINVL